MRLLQFGCCLSFPLLLAIVFLKSIGTYATINEMDGDQTHSNNELKGRLVFAHVLYRHGDRMPIEPYPTDPWKDRKNWPTGWGQLTNIGKTQHYHLGQWLRMRYDSLLSPTYSNDEIYIRSTDVDRTLMSALSNLAGLYPPEGDQIWNKDIPWQPIPVHTMPEHMDETLGKAPCTAYSDALSELMNCPEFQQMNERYSYLYNYLSQYTGRKIDSMEAAQRLNNTFFIETLYNKTLPEWTKRVFPSSDLTYISDFYFSVATYTRELARLKVGPLIKEILRRFDEKAKKKLNPDRNVWIYSAHDTTISNVLNGLKLFDIHSPDYASCILLEMRINEKDQPSISIFYKNNTAVIDPKPLHIPGCGISCPLKNMFSLYKDIIPNNWKEECEHSALLMTYEEANISLAMGILVAIISVMLILSYIVMVYYRRRSYKNHFSYSQKHKGNISTTKTTTTKTDIEDDKAQMNEDSVVYERKVHRTSESDAM